MATINLSIAMSDYDHVRDLIDGRIQAQGISLTSMRYPIPEIFFRFLRFREWDVSELSFAKYASLRAADDASLTAIPVFPSRVCRHSSFFVRAGSGLRAPSDLRGARVGVPEWAQTAGVYARGLLMHEYGVQLADIEWYQGGVNDPGRTEKVSLSLPDGVRITHVPDRSLDSLLLAGELDAVISAQPPDGFLSESRGIVRMIPEYRTVEQEYMVRTGIFPIMHVVVIRSEVLEEHPWVAMNLFTALDEARRRSLGRLRFPDASLYPLPWLGDYMDRVIVGPEEDWWPYGLEGNRTTLEAFLGFNYEQGVTSRLLLPEELFAAETLVRFRA